MHANAAGDALDRLSEVGSFVDASTDLDDRYMEVVDEIRRLRPLLLRAGVPWVLVELYGRVVRAVYVDHMLLLRQLDTSSAEYSRIIHPGRWASGPWAAFAREVQSCIAIQIERPWHAKARRLLTYASLRKSLAGLTPTNEGTVVTWP